MVPFCPWILQIDAYCCNPSFGFATKARAYKVAGQEGNVGVTLHAPRSVRECEGMNLHTPKGIFTLGVGVPMDSQFFFQRAISEVKTQWIEEFLISLERSWNVNV
jgi:hypothetical protein